MPALLGARLAGGILAGRDASPHPHGPAPPARGSFVATSFGYVGLRDVELLPSGFRRAVLEPRTADRAVVRVVVSLGAVRRAAAPVSPARFRLRLAADGAGVAAAFAGGSADADGRPTDLVLRFRVPRVHGPLRLAFADPGRPVPIVFDLAARARGEGGVPHANHARP